MIHTPELSPRPPIEQRSIQLEIAKGCPQKIPCAFCGLYENSYTPIDRDVIAADLDEIDRIFLAKPKRIFLQSGDPFALPHDDLIAILDLIHEKLPSVETIGGFCRIATVMRQTDEQLAAWAARGVSNLAMGAESGDDETLEMIGKQHRGADIVEQCARLDAAGITYTLFYMPGLAGAGNGQRNAHATAKVFSQTHPLFINAITTTISPRSRLSVMIEEGTYEPATEIEILQEIRTVVAELECETVFDCMNEANTALFIVGIPENRNNPLEQLDSLIATADPVAFQKYRAARETRARKRLEEHGVLPL